jgi:hypothetical protein
MTAAPQDHSTTEQRGERPKGEPHPEHRLPREALKAELYQQLLDMQRARTQIAEELGDQTWVRSRNAEKRAATAEAKRNAMAYRLAEFREHSAAAIREARRETRDLAAKLDEAQAIIATKDAAIAELTTRLAESEAARAEWERRAMATAIGVQPTKHPGPNGDGWLPSVHLYRKAGDIPPAIRHAQDLWEDGEFNVIREWPKKKWMAVRPLRTTWAEVELKAARHLGVHDSKAGRERREDIDVVAALRDDHPRADHFHACATAYHAGYDDAVEWRMPAEVTAEQENALRRLGGHWDRPDRLNVRPTDSQRRPIPWQRLEAKP